MTDLFLVVDNFDAEVTPFFGLEAVQAFLKDRYQQNPVLYQVLTGGEQPRLLEHDIPEAWKYIDPEGEGESA